jgi:nucleoside-diphosphate-sugar epimerase
MIEVLVTGSSGRVGAAVAAALIKAGSGVRGLDRTPGPYTTVTADLADLRPEHLDGVTAVVHTAALHAPHVGAVPDAEFRRVNVAGTEHLLALAADRRLVYTSTTSVYGAALVLDGAAVWVTEALTPQPRDVYDDTKLAAERLVGHAANAIVLRMARCFPEPPATMATYRMHRGVALDDVVTAHVAAVYADAIGVVNVAGPYRFQPADVRDLWHDAPTVIARRYPGVPEAYARNGWRLPDRIDRVYASDAASAALGWRPVHDVWECL